MKRPRSEGGEEESDGEWDPYPQDSEAEIVGPVSSSDSEPCLSEGERLEDTAVVGAGQPPQTDPASPNQAEISEAESGATLVLGGGRLKDLVANTNNVGRPGSLPGACSLSIFEESPTEAGLIDATGSHLSGSTEDHVPVPRENTSEKGKGHGDGGPVGQFGLKPPVMGKTDEGYKPLAAWRDPFLEYFNPLFEHCEWNRCIRLGTCCSGSGSPRLGLKAIGLPVTETVSVDPSPASFKAVQSLGQLPDHHLQLASELLLGEGMCSVHKGHCRISPLPDDIWVCGFPCAPFSTQRPDRYQGGQWKTHIQTEVMYEVAKCLAKHQPALAVLENVPGFVREGKMRPAFAETTVETRSVC